MMTQAEFQDEDEDERFVDVDERVNGTRDVAKSDGPLTSNQHYDARKRDPEHAHAERSCLWDLLPFLQHFHPSVSLFANSLLQDKGMPNKPDPAQHTLMHFLDRFVYRNAKTKAIASHGSSIMQPLAGSNAADLLVKPGNNARKSGPLNTEAFWQKKVEDVAADEVFFHSYFNQGGHKKRTTAVTKASRDEDEEGSEDEGEDEIWQAIANSKPEVEGLDEDDDISLGDLESAYSDSDDGSEPGLDLGGEDDAAEGSLPDDESDADALPELESGDDDAFFDDDDDVPMDVAEEEEEAKTEMSAGQKKRKEKRKLKSLPTFASVEDYAKLLDAEPDDM